MSPSAPKSSPTEKDSIFLPEAAKQVLEMADDELVLGWRDSEWTGVAPFLEEDVAFSSIAQGEIGHARALYELVAAVQGGDADALAFDRTPEEYRCAPFVELQLVGDWAATIARHGLYESADAIRVKALMESDWPELAGLAAKMDREEAYHRMHAHMWLEKLNGNERFEAAFAELWPYALGVLEPSQRGELATLVGRDEVEAVERGTHVEGFAALHEEMTMVRRSIPGAAW
jgi:ring-1,2-phenylacetyl-CoA epoxidase subunit PaaC